MRLAHMTWPQAETYFKTHDTVLLTVGSIECHGRHLPLGTDTMIPNRILELLEEKNKDILIVPTIPFGSCDSLEPFPGTINLGVDLLYQLLRRIVDSLKLHGARKFIFLNGHGGNVRTIEKLGIELDKEGCLLSLLNWWLNVWEMDPAWKGGHGGGEETAGIMGIDPSLVDMNEINKDMILKDVSPAFKATGFNTVEYKGIQVTIPRLTNHVTDNGWIGPDHPNTATEEWGKKMLQAMADYLADFVLEFEKVKLPR
ncbi:creatininase [Treponema primitia ZAS-2]|uniref:Creatininase n=1 Tax=Treponema primitia (strain ATCC BAA-887 / DSM 12427 / ZAS-2) TaxID=545694 RepID=F5YJY2_TREPZ|nr:creatininase family protein [Treponema primitia]AEF87009.1 creatininase [Treponema primitia ZAS-2]